MTVDDIIKAGGIGGIGLLIGKLVEIWITRANAKDANSVTLVNHTSEQTKVLIDQLRQLIIDQTGQIKDLTTERNNLQMDVFRITPMAQKMIDFEGDMEHYGMTVEDCIILVRESTMDDGVTGKRWTDRVRRAKQLNIPKPDIPAVQ